MTTITTKDNTNRSFATRGKSKELATEQTETVWAATYDLLRSLRLTTFFGNPGSTEQPFLKNFPSDWFRKKHEPDEAAAKTPVVQ